MIARVLVTLSVVAGCSGAARGTIDPATDADLDIVLPGNTYVGGIDVAQTLRAAVIAPYRGAIDRQTHEILASLPPGCNLDVLGSLHAITFGAHDGGIGGSLVAHGLPTDHLRGCLASGNAAVAVVRTDVYRVAVEQTEIEIRLVDRDTTWVRWAPQGTLGEPATSREDPYELRPMLARVDRSATAWVVTKPSAADLRDMWADKDLPPPIAVAASVQLGRGVALDADYRTASEAAAHKTSDTLGPQLALARSLMQLDISMHADGDALHFHMAANAATVQRLFELVGALDSLGTLGDGSGSAGSGE